MANMFALILVIATLVTGIVWCIDRFKLAPARRAKLAAINSQTEQGLDVENARLATKAPGWIETCASVFPVLALVLVIRSFVYEPFQIPSGSMMPTLLIGDFILVEKFAYGLKDPVTQTTLIPTGHPKRGDIVVFKYPLDPRLDYIKRAIGLPGDKVVYDPYSKELTVYPACQQGERCDRLLPITYSPSRPSEWVQTFNQMSSNEPSSGFHQYPIDESVPNGYRMDQRQETLGTVTHSILTVPQAQDMVSRYYRQPGQPLGTWVVPAGHYFMMGDNRDNSADSRYWGFVPEKNLVGKATAIWMSFKKQEGQWPTGVRLERIGGIH